jgi:PII-like signaling protein
MDLHPSKKVIIYVNEDAKFHHHLLYQAVLKFLLDRGAPGASAIRCLEGFGSHHQLHTPKLEALAEHLPIRIEFVDTPERVEALLPDLAAMVTDGLISIQDAWVVVKNVTKDVAAKDATPGA